MDGVSDLDAFLAAATISEVLSSGNYGPEYIVTLDFGEIGSITIEDVGISDLADLDIIFV